MIIRKESVKSLEFNGLKILDYTADLDGSSSFAIITVPPESRHGLSWSKRSDKYYYVVQGSIAFMLENDSFSLSEGDFCLVKKGENFDYRNETQTDVKLILFHTPSFDLSSEVFE